MIGATVDQYKITKAIENRNVYEIFLAQHIQTGANYELHAVHPNLTMKNGFAAELKHEISQLIALEHPAIHSPINILEVDQRLYIVYPFEDARSLSQLSETSAGQFPIDGLMRIFKDILRGIGFAHSEGFHHRALCLDAIHVNDEGQAKLRGFGRVLFDAMQDALGREGMISYARYYAPERFTNPLTEDIRANIYSLGAILYHLSTGQLPVDGESLFMLEMAHADHDQSPKPANQFRNDLPTGFSEMLQKSLEKRPESRFQNPIEFYKEIEKIESKKKSALFDEDFVKGFGQIENDSFSITGDELGGDNSSSFKIEDSFGDAGFNLGFEEEPKTSGPKGTGQFDLDKTVRDTDFDPMALSGLEDQDGADPFGSDPFATPPQQDPFGDLTDGSLGLDSEKDEDPFAGFDSAPQPQHTTEDFSFDLPSEAPDPAFDRPGEGQGGFDFDLGGDASSDPSSGGIDFNSNQGTNDMVIEGNDAYNSVSQDFSSDDGAFHFTPATDGPSLESSDFGAGLELEIPPEPDMPQEMDEDMEPMPRVRRMERGLEDSLQAAGKRSLKPTSLKKKNKLVPVLIVLGVIAIGAAGYVFYENYQKNQTFLELTQDIKARIESNRFREAQSLIQTNENSGFSADQKKQLDVFKAHIEKALIDVKNQVDNHFEKARVYETQGKRLVDGENDAFAEYKKISKLDPDNVQAVQDMTRIRDLEIGQIDQMVEDGRDVEALLKLRVLKNNYSNQATTEKYEALFKILQEGRVKELESSLVEYFESKKFPQLIDAHDELAKIDPSSKFLADKSKEFSDKLLKIGQEFQEKQLFDKAQEYYQVADKLLPNNGKIQKRLESVASNAAMLRVERAENRLDDALLDGNNLKDQLAAAKALSEIDPGNIKSNNALIEINEKIRLRRVEAERMRSLGRFREASEQYKDLYDITGNSDVKALWLEYRSWKPPKGMVYIPGGRYRIGYNADRISRPEHNVTLSPYYADKYEVTNEQFKAFVDANPKWRPGSVSPDLADANYLKQWENNAPAPGTEYQPVVYVSYYAAKAYARFAGKRLLTEAEWEITAAGGTTDQRYWWGNSSSATSAVYNKSAKRTPVPVGTFPANEYGVYEILGNVSEWVEDAYDPEFYYQTKDAKDPVCEKGEKRIHRGGSYRDLGREITIQNRFVEDPRACSMVIGLRCGKDAQ